MLTFRLQPMHEKQNISFWGSGESETTDVSGLTNSLLITTTFDLQPIPENRKNTSEQTVTKPVPVKWIFKIQGTIACRIMMQVRIIVKC
jgi:hypothetical protein